MADLSFLETLNENKLQHKADNLGVDVETLKAEEIQKHEALQTIIKDDSVKEKILVHKFKTAQAGDTVHNVMTFEDVSNKTKYTISVNISALGIKTAHGMGPIDPKSEQKLLMLQTVFTEFLTNIPDKVLT